MNSYKKMEASLKSLPKAELHVHIEGTVTPDMVRRKAAQHGITLPDDLFTPDGKAYNFRDFVDLVTRVYDLVAQTIRTRADFEEITYDYLKRSADEGVIYTEFIMSADHCERLGLPYGEMLAGMADAIDRARVDFDIEARMNTALVRHLPDTDLEKAVQVILANPHPYVTGIDLAGAEKESDLRSLRNYFDRIAQGGKMGVRLHAGEAVGCINVREALDVNPARIGHGVRVMEDENLVQECVRRGVVFEVCPTSNVLAGIFPSYAAHPLPEMIKAGLRVTLASDDPGLFNCTIGGEYQVARDKFGMDDQTLLQFTRTGIESAFVDEKTRQKLLQKINAFKPV